MFLQFFHRRVAAVLHIIIVDVFDDITVELLLRPDQRLDPAPERESEKRIPVRHISVKLPDPVGLVSQKVVVFELVQDPFQKTAVLHVYDSTVCLLLGGHVPRRGLFALRPACLFLGGHVPRRGLFALRPACLLLGGHVPHCGFFALRPACLLLRLQAQVIRILSENLQNGVSAVQIIIQPDHKATPVTYPQQCGKITNLLMQLY